MKFEPLPVTVVPVTLIPASTVFLTVAFPLMVRAPRAPPVSISSFERTFPFTVTPFAKTTSSFALVAPDACSAMLMGKFTSCGVQANPVSRLKKFTVTIQTDELEAIKACNPKFEVDKTPNGVRVAIEYGDGGAVISLPTSLADSSASTGRCVPGETGNVKDAVIYRADWAGGLPERIDLNPLGEAFFDKSAMIGVCKKLLAERKFH